MNEVASLLYRFDRYLTSARLLLQEGDCESSVSRSYYAMFYAAPAVLLTRNISASSHKGVISNFGKEFVKAGIFSRDLGRELNRAFGKRQLSDYEYTFVISQEEAEDIEDNGRDFVEKIRRFLQSEGLRDCRV